MLYVSHGHPEVMAGGAEVFALELFEGIREDRRYEPVLVARVASSSHDGTPLAALDGRSDQFLFHGPSESFDYFLQSQRNKIVLSVYLRDLLTSLAPDLVHFQHTLHLGMEMIQLVRTTLPRAPIVYTLHEFSPICFADGQMLRPTDSSLCDHASPRRCHECFPRHSPAEFKMRELFIKSQLSHVDQFLAPSECLRGRFVDWGLADEKIGLLDYGRQLQAAVPPRVLAPNETRSTFGYFGQINPYKGVFVLLEAMRILKLQEANHIHLYIHGDNLKFQTEGFRQEFESRLAECQNNVTFVGRYSSSELPSLMEMLDWVVVPSVWWENSPLVIQEAKMHRRPIICSNIGGMSEKVKDDVNGLHFRVNDPQDLARTMLAAANEQGTWSRLRAGIEPVGSITECVDAHVSLYDSLLAQSRAEKTYQMYG